MFEQIFTHCEVYDLDGNKQDEIVINKVKDKGSAICRKYRVIWKDIQDTLNVAAINKLIDGTLDLSLRKNKTPWSEDDLKVITDYMSNRETPEKDFKHLSDLLLRSESSIEEKIKKIYSLR